MENKGKKIRGNVLIDEWYHANITVHDCTADQKQYEGKCFSWQQLNRLRLSKDSKCLIEYMGSGIDAQNNIYVIFQYSDIESSYYIVVENDVVIKNQKSKKEKKAKDK